MIIIQIVIDIPTKAYEAIQACKDIDTDNNGNLENVLILAVEKGIVMPEDMRIVKEQGDVFVELR